MNGSTNITATKNPLPLDLNAIDLQKEKDQVRDFMAWFERQSPRQQKVMNFDAIKRDMPFLKIDKIRKDYNIPDRAKIVEDYKALYEKNIQKPSVYYAFGGGNPEQNAIEAIAKKYDIDAYFVQKWAGLDKDYYGAVAGLNAAVKGATMGLIEPPGTEMLRKEYPISSVVGEMAGAIAPISGISNIAGKVIGNIPRVAQLPKAIQTIAKTGTAGALYSGGEQAIEGEVSGEEIATSAGLWAGLGLAGETIGLIAKKLRRAKDYREAAKALKEELELWGAPERPLDDYVKFYVKQKGIPIGTPVEIKPSKIVPAFGKKTEHIRSGATLYETIWEEPALRQRIIEEQPYLKGIPGFAKKGYYALDKRSNTTWQIGSVNPKKNRITLWRTDDTGNKIKLVEDLQNLNRFYKKDRPLQTGKWESEIFEYTTKNTKIPVETMPQWGDDFVKVGTGKTIYYKDGIKGWMNKSSGQPAKGNVLNALNFYDTQFNKSAGFFRLPSSEDWTQAGVQLSKLNLYTNLIGNRLWAMMEKIPNILPESVGRYFLTNYGTRGEFMALARKEFARTGMSIEDGMGYADRLAQKLSKSEQLELTKLITNPQRKGLQLARGTKFEDMVDRMQTDLKNLMSEAVNEGLFTEATAKFYQDRYLPRLFKRHFETEGKFRVSKMKFSGRTKARGKSAEVTEDELEKWLDDGYEIYAERKGKYILKKFEPHGDITEATALYAKGMADLSRDISLARILKKVSQDKRWVSDLPADDFIPLTKTSLFKNEVSRRFLHIEDIGNKFIHKDIHNELQDLILMRAEWQKFLSGLMGMWKIGKTGFSTLTHIRNITSNFILADMGGLSPRRLDIYTKALWQMAKGGKYLNEAKAVGIFGQDFYNQEVLQMLNATAGSKSPLSFVNKLLKNKYVGAPARLYQAEEQMFKFAKFIHNRQKGMSADAAAEDALKWLFDYSNTSRFVGLLRKTAFPFITFAAKAAPRTIETIVKHPFRMAKYYIGFHAFQQFSKYQLGMTEEEYQNLMENRPDYMNNGSWILLPWKDSNGNYQFFNATYYLPWGNFIDPAPQEGMEWMPQPVYDVLVPNNPFVRMPYELAMNKSIFTQRDIRKPEESLLGSSLEYAAQTLLPPDFPVLGSRSDKWENLTRSIFGMETKPNRFGERPSLLDVTMNMLGAQSVNPKRSVMFKQADKQSRAAEIQERYFSVTYDFSLSDEEKLAKQKKLIKMYNDIANEK